MNAIHDTDAPAWPVPHCHVVVPEREMASLLSRSGIGPCDGTKIITTISELPHALPELAEQARNAQETGPAGIGQDNGSRMQRNAAAALCCCTKSEVQTPAGGRTLRTPSKRDHDVCTTAPSHPAYRSGCLGSGVRFEAASAPRTPHRSRHQLGGTPGSCGRGRPWCQRPRRQRQWACPRHVTILNLTGRGSGAEAHSCR